MKAQIVLDELDDADVNLILFRIGALAIPEASCLPKSGDRGAGDRRPRSRLLAAAISATADGGAPSGG